MVIWPMDDLVRRMYVARMPLVAWLHIYQVCKLIGKVCMNGEAWGILLLFARSILFNFLLFRSELSSIHLCTYTYTRTVKKSSDRVTTLCVFYVCMYVFIYIYIHTHALASVT